MSKYKNNFSRLDFGQNSLGDTTHDSSHLKSKFPNHIKLQHTNEAIEVINDIANTVSSRAQVKYKKGSIEATAFPRLDIQGSTKKNIRYTSQKKRRPQSSSSPVIFRSSDQIPQLAASQEDVTKYKILRLTNSYL